MSESTPFRAGDAVRLTGRFANVNPGSVGAVVKINEFGHPIVAFPGKEGRHLIPARLLVSAEASPLAPGRERVPLAAVPQPPAPLPDPAPSALDWFERPDSPPPPKEEPPVTEPPVKARKPMSDEARENIRRGVKARWERERLEKGVSTTPANGHRQPAAIVSLPDPPRRLPTLAAAATSEDVLAVRITIAAAARRGSPATLLAGLCGLLEELEEVPG